MIKDDQLLALSAQRNLLSDEQRQRALDLQAALGGDLYWILLDQNLVEETRLVEEVSRHLRVPSVSLATFRPNPEVCQRVEPRLARWKKAVPLAFVPHERNEQLFLAMVDPSDIEAMEAFASMTGADVIPFLAGPRDVAAALDLAYGPGAGRISVHSLRARFPKPRAPDLPPPAPNKRKSEVHPPASADPAPSSLGLAAPSRLPSGGPKLALSSAAPTSSNEQPIPTLPNKPPPPAPTPRTRLTPPAMSKAERLAGLAEALAEEPLFPEPSVTSEEGTLDDELLMGDWSITDELMAVEDGDIFGAVEGLTGAVIQVEAGASSVLVRHKYPSRAMPAVKDEDLAFQSGASGLLPLGGEVVAMAPPPPEPHIEASLEEVLGMAELLEDPREALLRLLELSLRRGWLTYAQAARLLLGQTPSQVERP